MCTPERIRCHLSCRKHKLENYHPLLTVQTFKVSYSNRMNYCRPRGSRPIHRERERERDGKNLIKYHVTQIDIIWIDKVFGKHSSADPFLINNRTHWLVQCSRTFVILPIIESRSDHLPQNCIKQRNKQTISAHLIPCRFVSRKTKSGIILSRGIKVDRSFRKPCGRSHSVFAVIAAVIITIDCWERGGECRKNVGL